MEQDQARKYIHELLALMSRQGGSDLFLTAGFPPAVKVDGRLARLGPQVLTPPHTAQLGQALLHVAASGHFTAQAPVAQAMHGGRGQQHQQQRNDPA